MSSKKGCYDGTSPNGGLWLDSNGRSCIYYEYEISSLNSICNVTRNTTYDPYINCCICRGEKSLSINGPIYIEQYVPVWAIVVVAFCLLIICLLSVSFYFICHLYRNEKRQNLRLQKASKSQRNGVTQSGPTSKLEISKTDIEIEDEYAAIPGDIGVGNQRKKNNKNNTRKININIMNGNGDNTPNGYDDDDGYNHTHSPTSSQIYKVNMRPSFRLKNPPSNVPSNASSNSDKNKKKHNADSSISISLNNNNSNKNKVQFVEPIIDDKNNQNSPLIASDDEEADVDDYAAIDPSAINKNYSKNAQDVKHIKENMKSPLIVALKGSADHRPLTTRKQSQSVTEKENMNNNNNENNNNKVRYSYKRNETPQRRYSAELEFNGANSFHNKQRKRQSSKFINKRFEHSYHQTQDDMIFLSFGDYLDDNDNDDDDEHEHDTGNETEDDENTIKQINKSIVPDLIKIPYKNKNKKNKTEKRLSSSTQRITKEHFTRISTKRVIKLFAPQEIKYSDIDFKNQEFIGKGSFGKVVKAKYHEIDVAVKTLHTQRLTGSELINFKREAAIMQKVGGHKHIARMYGFCTKPQICIVTEYYARGSLHDIIRGKTHNKYKNNKNSNKKNGTEINKKTTRISTELKISMSIEASLGIWHLHQHEVIHRDISARNLLVDKNWTVVVADLGMSRLKKCNHRGKSVVKSNIGPVKWMAPESIIGHEYSEKTDSYSFGITLYEIFSESEPYSGLLPLEAGAKVVHEGLRPNIEKNKKINCVPNLNKLLTMLWKPQPKDRPDFLFITQSLKKIKNQWIKWVQQQRAIHQSSK